MNRGYVKLWRKIFDAGWLKNPRLLVFWIYCLLKATHKKFTAIVGAQSITLLPGQFVFGLRVATQETGLTTRQIRTVLAFLINSGNLTIKTTNKFSIITIVNWHIYQMTETENDTQNDTLPTNNRQHTRTKEHKNKKIFLSDSIEIRLAVFLHENILSRLPGFKEPNIQSWAKDIDLMIRLDKRDSLEIKKVIVWCQQDSFWQSNILSTFKLRKQYDQLNTKRLSGLNVAKQEATASW